MIATTLTQAECCAMHVHAYRVWMGDDGSPVCSIGTPTEEELDGAWITHLLESMAYHYHRPRHIQELTVPSQTPQLQTLGEGERFITITPRDVELAMLRIAQERNPGWTKADYHSGCPAALATRNALGGHWHVTELWAMSCDNKYEYELPQAMHQFNCNWTINGCTKLNHQVTFVVNVRRVTR